MAKKSKEMTVGLGVGIPDDARITSSWDMHKRAFISFATKRKTSVLTLILSESKLTELRTVLDKLQAEE